MKTTLDLAVSGKLRLDPYLVWAWLTGYRDYLPAGAPRTIAVAIECLQGVAALAAAIKSAKLDVALSPFYLATDGCIGPETSHYCTATLPVDAVWSLLGLVDRLELGTAIDTTRPFGFPTFLPRQRMAANVVGVIDDFIAFGHPCFAAPGPALLSRVTHVWSQSSERPDAVDQSQWRAPKDLGYGYELSSLAGADGAGAPTLDELRQAYPRVLSRSSHGTPVADLAAGNHRDRKLVTEAEIIAVHLPKRTVADTSGGALSVQALDGLRYVMHRAGPSASVVVNLSYGTMAGPHDGSSIFERAVDELIDLREGRLAVVVPAGNAYESRGHALIELTKAKPSAALNWFMPPDSETPAFMEIWLPERAASRVGVKVTDPTGRIIDIPNAPAICADDGRGPSESSFGVVYLKQVANGITGTMILVAVAPTSSKQADRVLAQAGIWTVTLTASPGAVVKPIHAWIERDDAVHGQPRRGRQSYFIDPGYQMPGQTPTEPSDNVQSLVKRRSSFNTIATGANTMVVGGFVGKSLRSAPYTGSGPARAGQRRGPELQFRCEESPTLHGERAAANGAADSVRANGTSIAAPQFARQIAEWFKTETTLPPTTIREKLATIVSKPKNPKPEREGCGTVSRP